VILMQVPMLTTARVPVLAMAMAMAMAMLLMAMLQMAMVLTMVVVMEMCFQPSKHHRKEYCHPSQLHKTNLQRLLLERMVMAVAAEPSILLHLDRSRCLLRVRTSSINSSSSSSNLQRILVVVVVVVVQKVCRLLHLPLQQEEQEEQGEEQQLLLRVVMKEQEEQAQERIKSPRSRKAGGGVSETCLSVKQSR